MLNIKEKINNTLFLWIGVGLVVLTMIMIGIPAIEVDGTRNSGEIFWNQVASWQGSWPLFLGYMLVLAAGISMGLIAIGVINIDQLMQRIILICAAVLLLIGAILMFAFKEIFLEINGWSQMANIYKTYAGPYIAGSLSVVASLSAITAIALDW
jgi:hypothetical protein